MNNTILDADGRPIAPTRTDPQAQRIAELERENEQLRSDNRGMLAKLKEDQIDMLVNMDNMHLFDPQTEKTLDPGV